MRAFFYISYNGKKYHGWQRQENAISVQEIIHQAFGTLLGIPIEITGSGRTDTGVHAIEQVFHADVPDEIVLSEFKFKLNSLLPKEISINDILPVNDQANARFDAINRTYNYFINRHKNPFTVDSSYYFRQDLSVDLMNSAASRLQQYKDFECFSKVKTSVNNFNCTIFHASWKSVDQHLVFEITANRFLRGMVRSIVGTMLDIGQNKLNLADLDKIILSKDRKMAGRSVPAHGLFLLKVNYPKEVFL